MKLASYIKDGEEQLAILHNDNLYDIDKMDNRLPNNMKDFLAGEEKTMELAKKFYDKIKTGNFEVVAPRSFNKAEVLSPVPHPTSMRDGYAFRQHVATARRNRGVEMIPEFDQYPIFYFTNHNAVTGPGEVKCMPDHFEKLDFELEVGIVIGKKGRNVTAAEADKYIAGYLIMNDWSARVLQMEEMKLNLGPAKGKDFATSLGPFMITPDEMQEYLVNSKEGHVGQTFNLKMQCWVNGKLVSEGNMADMDWTFAEIIERVSYGTDIFPGDVIGSGTVGTGCFLELNGTGLLNDKNYQPQWLKDGDVVEMEVTGLGKLKNTIKAVKTSHSILALKKNTSAVS